MPCPKSRRLAADEDRHTELAWQIVEWCKAEGGAPVERALANAMRSLGAGDPARAAERLSNPQRHIPTLIPLQSSYTPSRLLD